MNGAAALAAGLQQLADDLRDLSDADAQAAALIAQAAPAYTDRRTGTLAAATVARGGSVVNPVRYAPYENARHPFLTRAAESVDWSAPHIAAVDAALDALKGSY